MAEFEYVDVNGRQIRVRPRETAQEIDKYGNFHRQPNRFTEGFGEGKNPVEKGRYHLVWAKLCHWSNRASIVRELLGLDEAISVNMVEHADHEKNLGWEFVYDKDNVDPVLDIQFLSEAYYKADDDYTGRTTVPALIDVKTGKVVNNDYHKLTNYFEADFKPFHKKNAPVIPEICTSISSNFPRQCSGCAIASHLFLHTSIAVSSNGSIFFSASSSFIFILLFLCSLRIFLYRLIFIHLTAL